MDELYGLRDEKYRDFQLKLIKNPDVQMIGVRTPQLRKIARRYKTEQDMIELLSYPDDLFEIRFITLAAIAEWPYEQFLKGMMYALDLIDNWALCDGFAPKCIKGRLDDFIFKIIVLISSGKEFYERFACVVMLKYYMTEDYLETILQLAEYAHTGMKNVQTGVAWLISEAAAGFYDKAKTYLQASKLDEKTYSLAVRKCCESTRLTKEQKNELKEIKATWLSAKKSEKSST